MRLGLDIDGVLCNFNARFVQEVIRVTGRNLFPQDCAPDTFPTVWDYPETFGYTDAEMKAVWKAIRSSLTFWQECDLLADAYFLPQLEAAHDIYFITARPGLQVKRQTELWLAKAGIEWPTVLLAQEKGPAVRALELDVFVDDKPENVLDGKVWRKRCKSLLFDRPYNRHATGLTRIYSLQEVCC